MLLFFLTWYFNLIEWSIGVSHINFCFVLFLFVFQKMGYAAPGQISSGIHMRQYARTFIIDDGANRVAYVNIDCGMIDQAIKTEVSRNISK